jgi:hypothetical protein
VTNTAPKIERNTTATDKAVIAASPAGSARPARTKGGRPAKPISRKETARRPAVASKTSKTDQVLRLLRHARDASIADISTATGWQPHSVRGFLSGTVKKRLGLNVISEKDKNGVRRYRVVENGAA